VPLVLVKNTNRRSGPALEQAVLTTLDAGTAVFGLAYRQSWIRVRTETGASGWVHQSLVKAR